VRGADDDSISRDGIFVKGENEKFLEARIMGDSREFGEPEDIEEPEALSIEGLRDKLESMAVAALISLMNSSDPEVKLDAVEVVLKSLGKDAPEVSKASQKAPIGIVFNFGEALHGALQGVEKLTEGLGQPGSSDGGV
jgi:hypothetical protein